MKNKFQHTKSDSEIRGFQQINVSTEISKTFSVTLETTTNYCPYSKIRAGASTDNSRIYAGTNFLPAIL